MTIERRQITDRTQWLDWRSEDMTASVGACLFGADVHPHCTAYQLWAEKSGLWVRPPIDPKLARRGAVIEKISPDLIREERPDWEVGNSGDYYRDPEERIGATPDFVARRPDIEGRGNVQVKSVGPQAFRRWRDRDTGETALPVWIAVQANIEAALMEATWAAVVAITIGDHGLDVEIIDVPIRPDLMVTFRKLAAEFWRRVREKDPYPIDWGRDAATVLDIFRDDDGSIVDLSDDPMVEVMLMQRDSFKQLEREGTEAEKRRKTWDAQLIQKMGNARTARFGSRLIKAPTIKVREAVRKAYSFRRLTVSGGEDDQAFDHRPSVADSAAREAP